MLQSCELRRFKKVIGNRKHLSCETSAVIYGLISNVDYRQILYVKNKENANRLFSWNILDGHFLFQFFFCLHIVELSEFIINHDY